MLVFSHTLAAGAAKHLSGDTLICLMEVIGFQSACRERRRLTLTRLLQRSCTRAARRSVCVCLRVCVFRGTVPPESTRSQEQSPAREIKSKVTSLNLASVTQEVVSEPSILWFCERTVAFCGMKPPCFGYFDSESRDLSGCHGGGQVVHSDLAVPEGSAQQ